MASIFGGPTLGDLTELWKAQDAAWSIPVSLLRTDGPLAEPPFENTTKTPFENITDDPQSPQPSPLAGAWQCPGCGMIYSMFVNSCACQTHRWVTTSNTTKLYPRRDTE